MREYALTVLALSMLSLALVKGQDLIKGETDKSVASNLKEVRSGQTHTFVRQFDARHVIFRPLPLTRQRNREIETQLRELRRRYKSKSSRRDSPQKAQVRAKSLKIANQYEEWKTASDKDFEIPDTVLPVNTEDDTFVTDPLPDEISSQQNLISHHEISPTETVRRNPIRIPVSENREPVPNSVNFVLNRPRREVNSNSSEVQTPKLPEVKYFTPSVKDTDDVRPSPNTIFMFSKLNLTRAIRDAPQNNSIDGNEDAKEKLDDEDSMETAETVLFHPLFVHRYRKAQKNLRRQSQMRPQNRPQRRPQRPQNRPQQKPTTRPQQRPQPRPQLSRPQRPAQSSSQNKRPLSTRRGQYYYVAAAGPRGQWVYYPIYYY